MALNADFQQQRPMLNSACVRSAPSQPNGVHLDGRPNSAVKRSPDEKTVKMSITR